MERRFFWWLSAAVVLLAFVLRELYVLQTVVLLPFSGDAGHYILYAHHVREGYFGDGAVPDAFRPPGYPALLYLTQILGGDGYQRLLQWQAIMGTATVAFTIGLGRQWLPSWAALLAGALLAVWPHHIAFTAEVLTEVFTGFLLTAALLMAAVAKDRVWLWVCAGLLFAGAALVNSVLALLPVVAGAAMIGRRFPLRWLGLIGPVVLMVGGWSMRPVEGGMDRAWINLVQGSHPLYHRAYLQQFRDPDMAAVTKAIDGESYAMAADPAKGLQAMISRLLERPGHYAVWYASKPWLLWSWDVQISVNGGPRVHAVQHSPLEHPPLSWVTALTRLINPALFAIASAFALYAAFKPRPVRMAGLAFLYFTAVHIVL